MISLYTSLREQKPSGNGDLIFPPSNPPTCLNLSMFTPSYHNKEVYPPLPGSPALLLTRGFPSCPYLPSSLCHNLVSSFLTKLSLCTPPILISFGPVSQHPFTLKLIKSFLYCTRSLHSHFDFSVHLAQIMCSSTDGLYEIPHWWFVHSQSSLIWPLQNLIEMIISSYLKHILFLVSETICSEFS